MGSRKEIGIILLADCVSIIGAWAIYYVFRVKSGLIVVPLEPEFLGPMLAMTLFWLFTFFLVGLYRPFHAQSRFDELVLVFKTLSIGCLLLFMVIFVDDAGNQAAISSRLLILVYWTILVLFVGTNRLIIRSVQRRMVIAGIGAHNTIIVGTRTRARRLLEEVRKYPALGLRVVGFVRVSGRMMQPITADAQVLGSLDDLPRIISSRGIRDALIALDPTDHDQLMDIVARLSAFNIGIKIVPDLYELIMGLARTNSLYGFPLIDISPQLMKPWEEGTKRLLDIIVPAFVLLAGLPLWLLIALAIKLESPGPVLYRQERVGKDGERFNMVKFRSMYRDAEKEGPRWADRRDPRITKVGRLLRRLHLDEIPQMWNVLKGEMSLVGPRPERPMFVEQLSRDILMYPRRLRVRPGVTGWAQVKHKYDESVEDVRKKVQYDLYYIENMSIRMDMKIIAGTVSHMLLGRGR